jgi:hypothetical protein
MDAQKHDLQRMYHDEFPRLPIIKDKNWQTSKLAGFQDEREVFPYDIKVDSVAHYTGTDYEECWTLGTWVGFPCGELQQLNLKDGQLPRS